MDGNYAKNITGFNITGNAKNFANPIAVLLFTRMRSYFRQIGRLLRVTFASGILLIICYATNVNNNAYNNNQWFGYTQLFNVSISDSNFDSIRFVFGSISVVAYACCLCSSLVWKFLELVSHNAQHTNERTNEFLLQRNNAIQSRNIRIVESTICFFYIYSEEVIKLNGRLAADAIASTVRCCWLLSLRIS